jgi:phage-related protein
MTKATNRFYAEAKELGGVIKTRHRYIPMVNRFIYVIKAPDESTAKAISAKAAEIMGVKEPQHAFTANDCSWRAYGVYRPFPFFDARASADPEAVDQPDQ